MSNDRTINSLQNQRIKDAVKLRDRRQRDKQQRFIIDGGRETLRAIDAGVNAAGVNIVEAFVCDSLLHTSEAQEAAIRLRRLSTCWNVTPPVFEKLAYGERADGVIAVAEAQTRSLAGLNVEAGSIVAVLDQIKKPGNVGAILRSADAADISAVILTDPRTDLFNPNCIRASLGTVFTLPIAVAMATEALAWLKQNEFQIFAARVDAAEDYTKADYRGSTAIVLGSEAEGLSAIWHDASVRPICLPMLGKADSLNVSVTAAILFYESLRQRTA